MRKWHYECLYFSSYSSKAVHFNPAHMILQSVHRVIEIVWYIYPYLPPKSSKFLFPGIQIHISHRPRKYSYFLGNCQPCLTQHFIAYRS